MQWFGRKQGPAQPSAAVEYQKQLEKISGYRDLARDVINRAYNLDVSQGGSTEATQLYCKALEILDEGLDLASSASHSGLGPEFSNLNKYQTEMTAWQRSVQQRLQDLQTSTNTIKTSNGSPQRHTQQRQQTSRPPLTNPLNIQYPSLRETPGRRSNLNQPLPSAFQLQQPQAAGARRTVSATVQKDDADFDQRVLSEVLEARPTVAFDDISGLESAKQALREAVILPTLRADLFQGLRAPVRGILMYGPPGNGKTMLAKALAHESRAVFFDISAASLTSKWQGDAEKLVRALFRVATRQQPSVIFIDEIDSILSARTSNEHDAMRRLKTEFLVRFDGLASSSDRVVVIGATNRPWDLDDAVLRRMPKRIYIPLPGAEVRMKIITQLLQGQAASITKSELESLAVLTEGYSASDLSAALKEAAMEPIRELGTDLDKIMNIKGKLRAITARDVKKALSVIKPSVSRQHLEQYQVWTSSYGVPAV